jgi:hypothetical protein
MEGAMGTGIDGASAAPESVTDPRAGAGEGPDAAGASGAIFSGFARPAPNRLEFVVRGVPLPILNGVRYACMARVKTVAVSFDPMDPTHQDVWISENGSAMHNELIGMRVGLVPLHLSTEEVAGFDSAAHMLGIDVAAGDSPRDVTTADITIVGMDRDRVFPPNPVTRDHALITVLPPRGEGLPRLALTARGSVGTGATHARYCPVSVFGILPVVDKQAVESARAEALKAGDDMERFESLVAPRIFAADESGDPLELAVFLESECGLDPGAVFESSVSVLASALRTLAATVPEAPSVGENGLSLREDMCMGELLRYELGRMPLVEQAGVFRPHQSEDLICISLSPVGGPDIRTLLHGACLSAASRLDRIGALWRSSGLSKPEAAADPGRRAVGKPPRARRPAAGRRAG